MADLKEILLDICEGVEAAQGTCTKLGREVDWLVALVKSDPNLKKKYEAAKEGKRGMTGVPFLKPGLKEKTHRFQLTAARSRDMRPER